jgi:microcystin-dependent protein
MADPFVAEIRIFAFNFAPKGWAFCNGQLLPLSQNTALFSLLGTVYGGDGKSNFALPDMQDSAPMHPGEFGNPGPGLSGHQLGEIGGSDFVTLLESEIPAHSHAMQGTAGIANQNSPNGNLLGRPFGGGSCYKAPAGAAIVNLAFETVAPAGGSLPHNNLQPYQVLNFCIALQGVFPPRH